MARFRLNEKGKITRKYNVKRKATKMEVKKE